LGRRRTREENEVKEYVKGNGEGNERIPGGGRFS